MQEITAEELARFDGRDGRPAYVAYEGRVYDVSESLVWTGGDHGGMHDAGRDLTDDHEDAPHGPYVVDFPLVGMIAE